MRVNKEIYVPMQKKSVSINNINFNLAPFLLDATKNIC